MSNIPSGNNEIKKKRNPYVDAYNIIHRVYSKQKRQ